MHYLPEALPKVPPRWKGHDSRLLKECIGLQSRHDVEVFTPFEMPDVPVATAPTATRTMHTQRRYGAQQSA